MDLILWRHAEAQDPEGMMTDLDRPLTRRGDKQATRMAAWLDRQLPEGTRILCSPAIRTEQTVLAWAASTSCTTSCSPVPAPSSCCNWPAGRMARRRC